MYKNIICFLFLNLIFLNYISGQAKLTIMQWNIGHFSGGARPYSTITDDNYNNKIKDFMTVFDQYDIDIVNFSEYSPYFIDSKVYKKISTKDLLYGFKYNYIGNGGVKRNFSLNAIFSKYKLEKSRTFNFFCNKNADMGKGKRIKAQDYYYIESEICFNDVPITIISTHFAFGKGSDALAIKQAQELIEKYKYKTHVIICGDFNMMNPESYSVFVNAKYELANHGFFGDFSTFRQNNLLLLDNIIVKGLSIEAVKIFQSDLSDHLPIICDIKLK